MKVLMKWNKGFEETIDLDVLDEMKDGERIIGIAEKPGAALERQMDYGANAQIILTPDEFCRMVLDGKCYISEITEDEIEKIESHGGWLEQAQKWNEKLKQIGHPN